MVSGFLINGKYSNYHNDRPFCNGLVYTSVWSEPWIAEPRSPILCSLARRHTLLTWLAIIHLFGTSVCSDRTKCKQRYKQGRCKRAYRYDNCCKDLVSYSTSISFGECVPSGPGHFLLWTNLKDGNGG